MARIAIDFDGTLFHPDENGDLALIEGAREALTQLKDRGHYIIIHTCRTGLAAQQGSLPQEVNFIEQALLSCGVPFDDIFVGEKLVADVYVDDRAVAFNGNWRRTASELELRLKE